MYVDWPNKVIYVAKADMTLVQSTPIEIRELNLNWFHLTLRDLEDDDDGMVWPKTHTHNTEVVLGGITYARVIEVINGYTVTFENGSYAVNLVGANSNVGDVINFNLVQVRSANAAGLISNSAIEFSSFNEGVAIDVTSSNSGTVFPAGTLQQPVNNLTDALIIANYRGLKKLYILENMTGANAIGSSSNLHDFIIEGRSRTHTVIEIDASADTTGMLIRNCTVYGTLDGENTLENCRVGDLVYFNGSVQNCGLYGTIYLDGDADAVLNNCITIDQDFPPVIDMGGTGQSLAMPNYTGIITIKNLTDATADVGIGLNAGYVLLDSTVTAGSFTISGIGDLIDNSTSVTLLDQDALLCRDAIADATWNTDISAVVSGAGKDLTTAKKKATLAAALSA